jgi:tetratricopeptide (TPR) repeat protein
VNRALALFLVVIAGAAPAAAQSKRYPPEPVDKDQDKADKSALWEAATNPNQEPYRALVSQAKQAIEQRTTGGLQDSVVFLDDAVKLLPHSPEAYRLRGEAYFWMNDWTRCAADLRTSMLETKAINALDKKAATDLQLRLGNCQARSGKLADAERTLAEAAAAGTGTGELLMRLGEVRIAMGKLDEAIAALTAALEVPDVQPAQTRFLLASAYDRARRPAEAIAEARRAMPYDRALTSLSNPQLAFIGTGEAHYLLALAWASNEAPRAEYAIAYYRQYLKEAPDSPWRKRAEEHLRDLAGTKFPETIERSAGTAPIELDQAALAIRKVMPAMRACMAKLPSTVIEVRYTHTGPPPPKEPAPQPGRGGYMYRPRVMAPPPPGAAIKQDSNTEAASRADTDGAIRCIDPIAAKLGLPPIKEKGGWYTIVFRVVAN